MRVIKPPKEPWEEGWKICSKVKKVVDRRMQQRAERMTTERMPVVLDNMRSALGEGVWDWVVFGIYMLCPVNTDGAAKWEYTHVKHISGAEACFSCVRFPTYSYQLNGNSSSAFATPSLSPESKISYPTTSVSMPVSALESS